MHVASQSAIYNKRYNINCCCIIEHQNNEGERRNNIWVENCEIFGNGDGKN